MTTCWDVSLQTLAHVKVRTFIKSRCKREGLHSWLVARGAAEINQRQLTIVNVIF